MRSAPSAFGSVGNQTRSQRERIDASSGAVPPRAETAPVKNVMSVDLEDWFCVYNLSGLIPYADWDKCQPRVERNTLRLLDLFQRHRVEATFFVLGWVADRFPDLVKEVERQGHEIATHGYSHRLLTFMQPEEFRVDLQRSLEALSKASSHEVRGFRAPSFSLTRRTLWAADILKESGLRYDSSVFPVRFHPEYGIPDAELGPYQLADGVTELPMSVAEIAGRRVPCCGGGYFRLYPYAVTRWLMRRCNKQGRPVIFYLHPWEIDAGQPRMEGLSWSKQFRHYNNLSKTEQRLERLLDDFSFITARQLLADNFEV
jgi:polysaccharide deacetylase family protein (PEP-CTERM system associated)